MASVERRALTGMRETKPDICGAICNCGPFDEPLACGFPLGHDTKHSWATLPTFNGKGEIILINPEVTKYLGRRVGRSAAARYVAALHAQMDQESRRRDR